ncbi:MAG: tetratricopeptide repeat protein [Methanosarcinales archaeon]|nr:tetratricopeptide repeat protein [Methanosarcinales archaeon]
MMSKEKVLLHKGMDQVKRGEYELAMEYFSRVLEINPENPEAWNNQGVALFRLGQVEEALASWDRAVEFAPENMEALRNKAFVFRSLGRLEEALEIYDQLVLATEEAGDYEAKAAVMAALGMLEEALAVLQDAYEMSKSPRIEEDIAMLVGYIEARRHAGEEEEVEETSGKD